MMISGVVLGLVLLVAPQAPPTAEQLLSRLDLTSFRNSTGPRHLAAPSTPSAAGFLEASSTGDGSASRSSGHWRLDLTILEVRGEAIDACFRDVAESGGSYFVQTVLTLTPAAGGYVARKGPAYAACPEWRRRSDAAPRP